jgi:hypothetical protein
MPENSDKPSSQKCEVDRWARALGLSTQRLLALVQEVVEERQAPSPIRRTADQLRN